MGALFSVPTVTEAIASLHFCYSRWPRVQVCGWTAPAVAPATAGVSYELGDASRSLPARGPRGDLLYEPEIAIGVVEGAEGPVAGALGVRAGLARLDGERRTEPPVTHVDTKFEEFGMGRLDVGDDEGGLNPPRRSRWESQAKCDRGRRAWGCELDKA